MVPQVFVRRAFSGEKRFGVLVGVSSFWGMSGDFSRPVLIHQVWVVWRAVFGRSVLNLPAEAKLPHPSSLTPRTSASAGESLKVVLRYI